MQPVFLSFRSVDTPITFSGLTLIQYFGLDTFELTLHGQQSLQILQFHFSVTYL